MKNERINELLFLHFMGLKTSFEYKITHFLKCLKPNLKGDRLLQKAIFFKNIHFTLLGQSMGMEKIKTQATEIRAPTLSSFGSQFYVNQQ